MTAIMQEYIVLDDHGFARIAGTRSKVHMIAIDHAYHGMTPREIHEAYPHLSLAQIHAALAYYFDHKAEMDALIKKEDEDYRVLRKAAVESPFARRMRAEGRLP